MNYKNIKHFPSNKQLYLTKKGLDNLKQQLNRLQKEKISMCKRLMKMDTKERAENISSNNMSNLLELNEIEASKILDILQHADVVEKNKWHKDIEVGSTVSLQSGHKTIEYTLVNSIEANPSMQKISEESPLGRQLLGKKEHSTVLVKSPKGKMFKYKVLSIH